MNYNEFLFIVSGQKFAVFGTGFAAESLYQGLVLHDHERNIACFYVSHPEDGSTFHGIPVCPLSDYRGDIPLLIALHPATLADISELDGVGESIYPFLSEYLYGQPLRENVRISKQDILSVQPEDEYWIASRYAGVKGLQEDDSFLTDLYLRCISLHASETTARLRLQELRKLCDNILTRGFDNSGSPICIDENRRIIDGLHRLAAAAYFDVRDIYCDIYASSEIFEKVLTERNRITPAVLVNEGFSREDIETLEEIRKKLG